MVPRRALPTDARATARRPDIFETDPRSRLSRGVTSERDEREATGTHAPMAEGPLAWLHPFDSGLHSFPSLDAGTDLLGFPPSNCGVAAKMAFSELAAMDLLRTPSGFDTRAADAQPPETSRRVTGADATSAGEKPFAFDAQRAHAGAPSTSYVPSEVRLPLIDDPCASDLPPFGSYRRSPRPTRAYAGGTLENQSTDVFSFPSQRPQVFSPVNFGDVDVTDALFAKVRIFTHTAIQPAVRFSRIARHPRARRRPNRAKLGKHVTSLFPRVP